jgi:hypothetical protein
LVEKVGATFVGMLAGSITNKGYVSIHVNRKAYQAHRLAFLYMTGEFPKGVVDHIDRNPSNNCWSNLRDVTTAFNLKNRVDCNRNGATGELGVSVFGDLYRAQIIVNRKKISLGIHPTVAAAKAAYLMGKRLYHSGAVTA